MCACGIGNKQERTRDKNSHPGARNTAWTAALYTIETTPELTHSQDRLKVCLHLCTSTTQPDVGVTYRGHTAVRPGWPPRRGRGRGRETVRVSECDCGRIVIQNRPDARQRNACRSRRSHMQLAVHCLTVELFSGGRQIGAAFVCAKLCESCGGAARATVLAGAWRARSAMARDAHVCGWLWCGVWVFGAAGCKK